MGLADLFSLSKVKYTKKIKKRTNEELLSNERRKRIQLVSAGFRFTLSCGFIPLTQGFSAISIPLVLRSGYIARQKQIIILQELQKRNIAPLKSTAADIVIPITASLAGIAIGQIAGEILSGPLTDFVSQNITPSFTFDFGNFHHPVNLTTPNSLRGAISPNLESLILFLSVGGIVNIPSSLESTILDICCNEKCRSPSSFSQK
ncbi:hypothetical protein HK096_005668, partial [Nowakowskiella sp. JEL0078]